jgi:hypothetical protein
MPYDIVIKNCWKVYHAILCDISFPTETILKAGAYSFQTSHAIRGQSSQVILAYTRMQSSKYIMNIQSVSLSTAQRRPSNGRR